MIKRKIQKISGSFYLNLPMNWIKKWKIKENTELDIEFSKDGSLKIAPEIELSPEDTAEKIVLPCERYVARQIIKKCLTGASEIVVKSSKAPIKDEIIKDIKRFVNKLPSAQIIDETPHAITIQNFKFSETPTVRAIKRMYQLTYQFFNSLLEGNLSGDIKEYLMDIDRFFIIVVIHIRHFLTHGIYSSSLRGQEFTPLEALDYRMLVENIHRIIQILNVNLDLLNGKKLNPKIRDLGEKIKIMFADAMNSFFQNNSVKACIIWNTRDDIVSEATALLEELKIELDHLIIFNFLRIAEYAKRIADLVA